MSSPDATITGLLARCTFPAPGTEVTCAVSGGADSLALLALAVHAGCRAVAVHVDHQLRDGSAAEAGVVAAAAERLGAGFRAVTIGPFRGGNVEATARAARYAVLPADVMTGHTADDQAETVLLNLLRGASAGVAAMAPGPRRPLLAVRRWETTAVCARLGLDVVVDPSNTDPRFRRNRVRHELLPLMDDIAQRDVAALLTRQADVSRADNELLDALAEALDPTDAVALAAAPQALARRAVRRWLTTDHPPDLATVGRVLDVAAGRAASCEVGGGRVVARTRHRLRLTTPRNVHRAS